MSLALTFWGCGNSFIKKNIARLCNGSTTASGAVSFGSNPSRAVKAKNIS